MKQFLKDYKTHISIWIQYWYIHVAFCLMACMPLWMIGQVLHPVQALMPTAIFFLLVGAWFVLSVQTTLPSFSLSQTLKKSPRILLKSLLFPFGAALIWGNPYTLSSVGQLDKTGGLIVLSTAITATFLLMNFTLLATLVTKKSSKSENSLPSHTSFWALMGHDLSRIWLLWKSTWKSSFVVLVHILSSFFPIALVASMMSALIVQLPPNMAWINIIPSVALFATFSLWPIIVGFQSYKTLNTLETK